MLLTPVFTPPLDTKPGGERLTVQLVDVHKNNGCYSFGFEKLERWIQLCESHGVEYFEFAHLFTQWGAKAAPKIMACVDGEYKRIFGWETDALGEEYKKFLTAFLPELKALLKNLGIAERCYFHISDEPGLKDLEQYKAVKAMVAPYLAGFAIIDALSDFDFYSHGALTKPIPAVDQIGPFIEAKVAELWAYYCVAQYKNVPNLFISMPSARNRILATMLYKYNIEGFLQWGYNFYNSQYSLNPVNPYITTDAGGAFPGGDSFQVYPGKDGIPEESLRFMVTAQALYDLRAMQMLEGLAGREAVMEILEGELSQPITFETYPKTDEYILNFRTRINREICHSLFRVAD
jgi:hypothetical protein